MKYEFGAEKPEQFRQYWPGQFGLFRSKFIFPFYNLPIAPNRGYAVLAKLEYQSGIRSYRVSRSKSAKREA